MPDPNTPITRSDLAAAGGHLLSVHGDRVAELRAEHDATGSINLTPDDVRALSLASIGGFLLGEFGASGNLPEEDPA